MSEIAFRVVWRDGNGPERFTKAYPDMYQAEFMASQLAADGMNVLTIMKTKEGDKCQ